MIKDNWHSLVEKILLLHYYIMTWRVLYFQRQETAIILNQNSWNRIIV